METKLQKIVDQINLNQLTNAQKALLRLLKADGAWVARTTFRIPSAAARLRDLRKVEFGALPVKCAPAEKLNKRTTSRAKQAQRQTYYALNTERLTAKQLRQAFHGAV